MRSRPVNQRRSPFRYGATQSPPACALLLLLAVALAFACGPARAGVPHYDLTVELEPAGRVLRVTGSITIPAGDTAVLELDDRFYLHEFEVDGGTAVEVGARPGGRKRWSVDASAGRSTEIRLRYAGRLNPLDTTLDHREVLGIAAAVSGADGAYLAAGSAWYPEPQGDGLTYRLAVTVPDGFRAVAPGRLVQEAGTRDGRVSVFESRVRLGGIDLIAGPSGIHAHCDVSRLLVDGGQDRASMKVESPRRIAIPDILDDFTDNIRDFDIGLGRNFTGYQRDASGQNSFASDAGMFVLSNDGIQDPVRNLVGDLIRMAFSDRFRSEQIIISHVPLVGSGCGKPARFCLCLM